jgi:capsular polysaccharide transport system permease protein
MLSGAASLISRFTGGSVTNTQQDSYIVLNYIKSSAIIVDLGGRAYLEKVFSRSDIDFFSRLSKGEPIEELQKYWRSRVTASVDTISGILTFKVTAYTPGDALRVAQDIDRLSEALINRISLRSRRDALERADDEVKRAGASLADARQKLLSFRNSNDLIDPGSRATSLGEMIGKLTLEKIDTETSLNALSGALSGDSPTERVMRAKLASLNQQIDALKAKLADPKGTGAVSSQIAEYERLKLDEQFAEKIYIIAQDSYMRARQKLDQQQLYLVTIVPPVNPEKATYPKIIASTLLLFVSLFIFWSIGALIWASIRDQME